MRITIVIVLLFSFSSVADAAPKLAPLPPAVAEIAPNFYRYNRSWTRLRRWVARNYGKQSSVSPLTYKNGVVLVTVTSKEERFKWSVIHFFKTGDKIRISIVPR